MSASPRLHDAFRGRYAGMLTTRGHVVLYRRQANTECPSCGSSNWNVGRSSAECATCELPIPLAEPVNPETILTPHEQGAA